MKSILIGSAFVLLSTQVQAACPTGMSELYSGPEVSAYCYSPGRSVALIWGHVTSICLSGDNTLTYEDDGHDGERLVGFCNGSLEIRY